MADVDVKEESEVSQAEPAPAAKPESPGGGGLVQTLTKVSILSLIGLVAIFAAYIITLKVLKPMTARTPTPVIEESAPVTDKKSAQEEGGHGGEGAHESSKDSKFYMIESIVVNPAGTAGTRFLSCSISFEMESSEDMKVYENMDVQIRDVLITILSSKTVDELSDIRERNRMRREMLSVINRLTDPGKARAVYLTDFVLQ